jgi:P27 family predicted phage terminase small subunit
MPGAAAVSRRLASDEWWRVAPELWRIGLLRVTDVAPLAAYCYAYAQWRTAVEALARIAAGDPNMAGLLIKTTDGNPRRNPLVKIASDAAEDMLTFAGQFGLTPVARSRLAAGGWEPRHRAAANSTGSLATARKEKARGGDASGPKESHSDERADPTAARGRFR